jgi:hypothetical protein
MSARTLHAVVCASIIGFCLSYLAADFGRWPRVFHDQVEHRLFVADSVVGAGPAGYAGLWLWALAGGLVAGGLAWLVQRARRERGPSGRVIALLHAWALSAFALGVVYFAWNNRP